MTEEETKLMNLYGITVETKCVYVYGDYRYDRLMDAVNYAVLETKRQGADSAVPV